MSGTVADERPEGRRTVERTASKLTLVWQSALILLGWVTFVYVYGSSPFGLAASMLRTMFGLAALITLGWAIEGAVMRKDWRLWVGALLVGAWLALVALVPGISRWWALMGAVGFTVASTTSAEKITASNERESDFLAGSERYAGVRRRAWKWAIGIAIAAGIIGVVAGVVGALAPGLGG